MVITNKYGRNFKNDNICGFLISGMYDDSYSIREFCGIAGQGSNAGEYAYSDEYYNGTYFSGTINNVTMLNEGKCFTLKKESYP